MATQQEKLEKRREATRRWRERKLLKLKESVKGQHAASLDVEPVLMSSEANMYHTCNSQGTTNCRRGRKALSLVKTTASQAIASGGTPCKLCRGEQIMTKEERLELKAKMMQPLPAYVRHRQRYVKDSAKIIGNDELFWTSPNELFYHSDNGCPKVAEETQTWTQVTLVRVQNSGVFPCPKCRPILGANEVEPPETTFARFLQNQKNKHRRKKHKLNVAATQTLNVAATQTP